MLGETCYYNTKPVNGNEVFFPKMIALAIFTDQKTDCVDRDFYNFYSLFNPKFNASRVMCAMLESTYILI